MIFMNVIIGNVKNCSVSEIKGYLHRTSLWRCSNRNLNRYQTEWDGNSQFCYLEKNGQTLLNGMFLCICRSVLVENSNIYFDSRSRRCGKPKTFTKVGIVPLLRPAIKSESHGSVGYDRINGVPCHGRNWHDKGPSMLRP